MEESQGRLGELRIVAIGASCSLTGADIRERLAEWGALRARARSVERIPGGARLTFAPDEPMAPVADLVARESECCPFYRFDLHVIGPVRFLEIDAGPGGDAAVEALLERT
jgi:hypothetical protein